MALNKKYTMSEKRTVLVLVPMSAPVGHGCLLYREEALATVHIHLVITCMGMRRTKEVWWGNVVRLV